MFERIPRSRTRWGLLAMVLLASGCGKPEQSAYHPSSSAKGQPAVKEYVVSIHPLHNPKRLTAVYGPIVDYINRNIPEAHFRLEASRNYEEYEKKLYAGHCAFSMPNPYQTLESLKHGYRIFGKMGDDEDFRGIILTRKDSGLREVSDLKGRAVSYPARSALAATMLPQYYLQTHGINVSHDIENRYVGSQESSIMSVYRGYVAAGATWLIPWKIFMAEHADMAAQLAVRWQTEPLVNNGWVVRKDVPVELVDKFSSLLFQMHESEQGREMLSKIPVSRFETATVETYQPVQTFLDNFASTVRPVEY
jgi:phosphonate transport system substrate-binding protein